LKGLIVDWCWRRRAGLSQLTTRATCRRTRRGVVVCCFVACCCSRPCGPARCSFWCRWCSPSPPRRQRLWRDRRGCSLQASTVCWRRRRRASTTSRLRGCWRTLLPLRSVCLLRGAHELPRRDHDRTQEIPLESGTLRYAITAAASGCPESATSCVCLAGEPACVTCAVAWFVQESPDLDGLDLTAAMSDSIDERYRVPCSTKVHLRCDASWGEPQLNAASSPASIKWTTPAACSARECAAAPSTPEDRRLDPSTLRVRTTLDSSMPQRATPMGAFEIDQRSLSVGGTLQRRVAVLRWRSAGCRRRQVSRHRLPLDQPDHRASL